MGRGVIVGRVNDEGLYRVQITHDQAEIDARIAYLEELQGIYEDKVAVLDDELVPLEQQVQFASDQLDLGIQLLQQAATQMPPDTEQPSEVYTAQLQAVFEAQVELVELAAKRNAKEAERNLAQLYVDEAKKEIAHLRRHRIKPRVEELWSADYPTIDIDETGQLAVGLIERNGESVDWPSIIYPHYVESGEIEDSRVNWTPKRDGAMAPDIAQGPFASYWNKAALPSWQVALPTYRIGTLKAIDYIQHTCTVQIDAAISSAGGLRLGINLRQDHPDNPHKGVPTPTQADVVYRDVPIWYMNCHSAAFDLDDRVVVAFNEQDWGQPWVIGFEQEPVPCTLSGFLIFPASDSVYNGLPVGENNIEDYRYFYGGNAAWEVDTRRLYQAGNIDWVGPADDDGNRPQLTWWGVPTRHFDGYFQYSFVGDEPIFTGSSVETGTGISRIDSLSYNPSFAYLIGSATQHYDGNIYSQGTVLYNHGGTDNRIAGAAYVYLNVGAEEPVKHLVYISSGAGIYVTSERVYLVNVDSEQQLRVEKYEQDYNLPISLREGVTNHTPWFFNASGTEAYAIRKIYYEYENDNQGEDLIDHLFHLTMNSVGDIAIVNEGPCSTMTDVFTDSWASEAGLTPEEGYEVRREPDPTIPPQGREFLTKGRNATGQTSSTAKREWNGEIIIAVDWKDDTPVFAKIIVQGEGNGNSTISAYEEATRLVQIGTDNPTGFPPDDPWAPYFVAVNIDNQATWQSQYSFTLSVPGVANLPSLTAGESQQTSYQYDGDTSTVQVLSSVTSDYSVEIKYLDLRTPTLILRSFGTAGASAASSIIPPGNLTASTIVRDEETLDVFSDGISLHQASKSDTWGLDFIDWIGSAGIEGPYATYRWFPLAPQTSLTAFWPIFYATGAVYSSTPAATGSRLEHVFVSHMVDKFSAFFSDIYPQYESFEMHNHIYGLHPEQAADIQNKTQIGGDLIRYFPVRPF